VAVPPTAITAWQSATVTVSGSATCGAVTVDYGDGGDHARRQRLAVQRGAYVDYRRHEDHHGHRPEHLSGDRVDNPGGQYAAQCEPDGAGVRHVFYTPASVALTASASDTDGSVASVQFYANGSLLATDSSAPFTHTWSGVGVGSYTLTAVATDNQGATTTSSGVGISAQQPAPSTIVTVSVSPESPVAGQQATVYVNGADPCGAAGIDYGDGESLFYPLDSVPFSKTHTWSSAGTYTITVTGVEVPEVLES
jgi:hypothetical protein